MKEFVIIYRINAIVKMHDYLSRGDIVQNIKRAKSLFAAAVIISILFLSFGIKQVFAENKGSAAGVDVVFVIDSSKSMTKSDPEGLTGEAMKMFIDMCHTKGDKGGMVAYSGDVVKEYKLKLLNTKEDKSALKNTLTNLEMGNWTDIGLGLKKAVNILKEDNSSGNKPIIILLSDGKNDPKRNKTESEDDLSAALNDAKKNQYPIYTIGLNADGTVDKNQLKYISELTNGKNFITNTADEIPNILRQIFADNFSLKVLQQETITGNEQYQQVKINIPDNNAVEANISILASKPVEIKLSNPKENIVQIPSDKFIYNKSSKYSLLKLISPEKGSWILYVKGSQGDKINISLISNYDLKASLKINQDSVRDKANKVSIAAYLESNGQKLEDKYIYSSSKAILIINDLDKSEKKEFPMEYNNNEFKGSCILADEDRYEVMIRIEGSGFIRESQVKTLKAQKGTMNTKTKPYMVYGVICLGVIIALFILNKIRIKRANKNISGYLKIQIKDNGTGAVNQPFYRSLNSFKRSFSMHELFNCNPSFSEIEKIEIRVGKDDKLNINNKSQCLIEAGESEADASGFIMKNHNKINVVLRNKNISITVKYFSS